MLRLEIPFRSLFQSCVALDLTIQGGKERSKEKPLWRLGLSLDHRTDMIASVANAGVRLTAPLPFLDETNDPNQSIKVVFLLLFFSKKRRVPRSLSSNRRTYVIHITICFPKIRNPSTLPSHFLTILAV